MKLSSIKRDVGAAENGVMITGAYGDINLKIAAKDNRKYKEYLQKLMKPYVRSKTYTHMSDEVFEKEIENKAIAKYILLGWENLLDDEGAQIPYSEQKAKELLDDPENIELRKVVAALSEEEEVFRKEAKEELANKSE